jgi:hypothetical protein
MNKKSYLFLVVLLAIICLVSTVAAGPQVHKFSADFTFSPKQPTVGQPINFQASACGGTPDYTYKWDIAGTTLEGQAVTFTPTTTGPLTIVLTVTDSSTPPTPQTKTVTKTITVNPPHRNR